MADDNGAISYAALRPRVLKLAARLRAAGVAPGDVVGVACDRSVDCVVNILAALSAGAAYLPLDLSYPSARLADMVEDARPRLIVISPGQTNDTLRALDLPVIDAAANETIEALPEPVAVGSESPAYVLFTSGSTGRPKGAVLSRRALGHMVHWHMQHARLHTPARTLQFATLGFDSSVRDLFATFATGGTLVLAGEPDRRDPFRLLTLMREQRIERGFLPYVALRAIAQAHAEGGALPESLRDLMTGGEALAITPSIRTLFAALPDAVLYNEYGPTEACVFVTSKPMADDPMQWPERPDIGAPLTHARLHVADEQLHAVVDGVEGELLIGGPSLADGYINRDTLSAERFVQMHHADGSTERVYRSGDRVRRDADGRIAFLGRADDQVKIAGYRVELGEVEAALTAHPSVRAGAVVAPQAADGARLVAHVVALPDAAAQGDLRAELNRHLAARLPSFARPQTLVFRDALPMTPNGKIDRRKLEAEFAAAPAPAASLPDANATVEQRIHALWRELLDAPELDVDANVFDHGADSLRVMSFVTRLRAVGIDGLSAPAVYEFPTARQQAASLSATPQPSSKQNLPKEPPQPGRASGGRSALAQLRERNRGATR